MNTVIYRVSVALREAGDAFREEFEALMEWMQREHIPLVLTSSAFIRAAMSEELPFGDPPAPFGFCTDYLARSREALETYLAGDSLSRRTEFQERWGALPLSVSRKLLRPWSGIHRPAEGESDLTALLSNGGVSISPSPFVFATTAGRPVAEQLEGAWGMFRETEGYTIISPARESADEPRWALLTMNIHSSLHAVGFLAALTTRLAQHHIPVNAVSAYFHDHLFVPWERREEAIMLLSDSPRYE